jgi:K+-transporting ATPase KdpF subunit
MNADYAIAAFLTMGLAGYLLFSLLRPEKF